MNNLSPEATRHAVDYLQVIKNRYGIIALSFIMVFLTVCVITYIMPKQYMSKARIQIFRLSQDIDVFNFGRKPGEEPLAQSFIETQFEIIGSDETLKRVVRQLDLENKWNLTSESEAILELLDKVDTRNLFGTDLIDIIVHDEDKYLAAKIAKSLAESYSFRRREIEKAREMRALNSLETQLKEQKAKMDEAMDKMHKISEEQGIVVTDRYSLHGEGLPGSYQGTTDIIAAKRQRLEQMKEEVASITSQIETLRSLSGEDLIRSAYGLGIEDSTVRQIYPQYLELQKVERELYDSGLGENHPRLKTLRGSMEKTRELLTRGVASIRKTLSTRLKLIQQGLEMSKKELGDLKDKAIKEGVSTISFDEAWKNYRLQEDIYKQMKIKFTAEKVDETMPKTPMQWHATPEVAQTFSKPNVTLNLLMGAVIGLFLGLGFAFCLEYMDTSVRNIDDVERYLQVPVLAVIPKGIGILHKQSGTSPDSEAYRILRTNIEFNRKSIDANSLTVVSGGAGEGKSTTLVNLAFICAQGGYTTLIIDGDLRRPRIHTFFDINNSVGLTNYLTSDIALEDVVLQTPIENLYFMSSGVLPADGAGILNSRKMSHLVMDVKSRFDLVLIDSPPILGVSDASVLVSEADLTVVVVQHRKLPRNMLMRVKQAIENVGGNLLGVVQIGRASCRERVCMFV